jgi:hypothetical protein
MKTKITEISSKLNVDTLFITQIYENVKANGRITPEDMSWLVSIGIPAFTILSKILNTTKSNAHNIVYDGKPGLKEFESIIDEIYLTI